MEGLADIEGANVVFDEGLSERLGCCDNDGLDEILGQSDG